MRFSVTGRGFNLVEILTANGSKVNCLTVEESSAIGDYPHSLDEPGSSFLWVGDRHHLNREQVRMLARVLEWWLTHRRLPVLKPKEPFKLDRLLTEEEADAAADYHDNQDTTTLMLWLYRRDLMRDEIQRIEDHRGLERHTIAFLDFRRTVLAAINMREFGIDAYSQVQDAGS